MLAAVALVVAAAVHTASHLLNTIPMLVSETNLTVLNANTKCTICANNEVCCILLPRVLQYPTCPFDALPTYKEVLFKSGIGLWIVLLVLWYFSRATMRRHSFNTFQHVHTIGVTFWVMLLWLHGSNQWVGIAMPLELLFVFPALPYYFYDRCGRCLCTSTRGTLSTVIYRQYQGEREGVDLFRIRVSVSKSFMKLFRPGMYAQIQVPGLSNQCCGLGAEWHPFTICSGDGSSDDSIEFIIAAKGDWTKAFFEVGKNAATQQDARQSLADLEEKLSFSTGDHLSTGTGSLVTRNLAIGGSSKTDSSDLRRSSLEIDDGLSESLLDLNGSARRSRASVNSVRERGPSVLLHGILSSSDLAVNVAGPYSAPTLSAKNDRVLIVVGGGVGITPFLSYLETLVSLTENEGKDPRTQESKGLPNVAHFFWSTRMVDDVHFAMPLLNKILRSKLLSKRIFIHIHVTTRLPKSDAGSAMLFREAIAMQSKKIKSDTTGAFDDLPRSRSNDVLLVRVSDEGFGIPIAFGRPNFKDEFYFIGRNFPGYHVSVYACGSPALVGSLQQECTRSNKRNESNGRVQRFQFSHERFD